MTTELKQYLDDRFDRLEAVTLMQVKNILTADEAATYIGYSIKGLYDLTCRKRIPHYKRNGKLYFKKVELDEWMSGNRVATQEEIQSRATTYVVTGRLGGRK